MQPKRTDSAHTVRLQRRAYVVPLTWHDFSHASPLRARNETRHRGARKCCRSSRTSGIPGRRCCRIGPAAGRHPAWPAKMCACLFLRPTTGLCVVLWLLYCEYSDRTRDFERAHRSRTSIHRPCGTAPTAGPRTPRCIDRADHLTDAVLFLFRALWGHTGTSEYATIHASNRCRGIPQKHSLQVGRCAVSGTRELPVRLMLVPPTPKPAH